MATGPSPHLSWSELGCKDGTPYPQRFIDDGRIAILAREFERVRIQVGQPIVIGSAYRTPTYNKKIGGAPKSQHVEGRALDLYPPKGMTVEALYSVVHAIAKDDASAICGLGKYPTFVHMDVRPSNRLTIWHGSRAWADEKDE